MWGLNANIFMDKHDDVRSERADLGIRVPRLPPPPLLPSTHTPSLISRKTSVFVDVKSQTRLLTLE